jgi:hypothetical protein
MIFGRYIASGCSRQYCGWREGKSSPPQRDTAPQREEWGDLVRIQANRGPDFEGDLATLSLVRKLMAEEGRKRHTLEQQIAVAEAKAEKAVKDFYSLDAEFRNYRRPWAVKAAHKLSKMVRSLAGRH